jgi:hypothetical protein
VENDYLEKKDTGRINKSKLLSEIVKALSISGDDTEYLEAEQAVKMAWN